MRIKVTPSAKSELYATIARLRARDRRQAAAFVDQVEGSLRALAAGIGDAPELASTMRSATAGDGHRLYVRERGGTLWLLAVWPDIGLR